MSPTQKSLDELRVGIDAVDRQLVAAINKRSQLSIELARLGRRLERATAGSQDGSGQLRAEQASAVGHESNLQKILDQNQGPIPDSALKGIYREILNGSHVLGRTTRVGYLGPQGTFSHLAASQHFGKHVDYENLRALQGVFEEVARGHVDFGLVPIETVPVEPSSSRLTHSTSTSIG